MRSHRIKNLTILGRAQLRCILSESNLIPLYSEHLISWSFVRESILNQAIYRIHISMIKSGSGSTIIRLRILFTQCGKIVRHAFDAKIFDYFTFPSLACQVLGLVPTISLF